MKNKNYNICVIGGDGIGPEVISETIKLLKQTPIKFNFKKAEAGYGAYKKYQTPLPKKTIDLCQKSDAILFGAVTTPPNIKEYFSPIVRLRKMLNLYANVRPFVSLPLSNQTEQISKKKGSLDYARDDKAEQVAPLRQGFEGQAEQAGLTFRSFSEGGRETRDRIWNKCVIDLIIVRENTEGLYTGRERLTEDGAIAERVITKKASERIIDFAFQLALQKKRKKVTLVHKANVLRITDGLFLSIGQAIAKKYPKIIFEDILVDSCAMKLIKNPGYFDIIVTTNMFGDILSDEAAGLVGGLGVAASANIGEKLGLFEPVHGSAPKYEGQNRANPTAAFLAACMMLDSLGETKQADKIRKAIFNTIKDGNVTQDLGGKLKMSEFTDEVINEFTVISSDSEKSSEA